MKITFYGAAREVTGSMHLLQTDRDNVLLDCGLFQGRRSEAAKKNRLAPFDPAMITNIVLSHAHIDHSGRLPLLVKDGSFAGRIVCTRATRDVCDYMLMDAAYIQESEAEYLNYKSIRRAFQEKINKEDALSRKEERNARQMLKKDKTRLDAEQINRAAADLSIATIAPLYTSADAAKALKCFEGIPYRTPVDIGHEMTVTFYEAGHILGSAVSIIKYREKSGYIKKICYTGDIGRFGKPIIRDPNLNFAPEDQDIDLMIIESTYGDREHGPVKDLSARMKAVLTDTFQRNGTVVIPAFAYGRAQEMLYTIHELYNAGDITPVAVYVDSPLASKLTQVFSEHPETYDGETHKTFLEKGENPFIFDDAYFVSSVEESMQIMRETKPHIVISASGMCEFGRILHHLRYKIHNPANTILIVGYMAENTLGRRILEEGRKYEKSGRTTKPPVMKILGKEYPLTAHVAKIDGFSAHADKHELMRFVRESNLKIKRAAIVHGEIEQSLPFSEALQREGIDTVIPGIGETIEV